MSSGKTHTRITYLTIGDANAAPLFFGGSISDGLILSAGVVSGLWLNPDLDIERSLPSQRWRSLRFIWNPYRDLFDHPGNFFRRNFWTHMPVVGLLIRTWPAILAVSFIPEIHVYTPQFVLLLIGLLLNDVIHLISDISQSYLGFPK